MNDLLKEMEAVEARAVEALAAATTAESSEAWYREYLGRTGAVTGLLKGLGQLSREDRPVVGKAANELKQRLEAALHERQESIRQADMEAAPTMQKPAVQGIDL